MSPGVRGVEDPSESTVEVIRLAPPSRRLSRAASSPSRTRSELSDLLRNRDIEVNPQYGTFNAATASVTSGCPLGHARRPAQ